jgi:hypothetical protein
VEVRCRVRVSDADNARVRLAIGPGGGSAPDAAVDIAPGEGGYSDTRVALGLSTRTCPAFVVRWAVRNSVPGRQAAARIDEVLVVGFGGREWDERERALADSSYPSGVVVNEIMYAPKPGEPEWVELLNAGDGAVSVAGWTLGDASGARSGPLPPIVIPAGGTVLITRDLAQFALARGGPVCEGAAPGSMPSLNNGGDAVIIRTAAGAAVDSVAYQPAWGGSAGRSLERRAPRSPPSEDNWAECLDASGATPCALNSVAVLPVDITVSLRSVYRIPHGSAAELEAVIRNAGSEPVRDIEIRWFIDEDHDGAGDAEEEAGRRLEAGPLAPGDSVSVTTQWAGARPGEHSLIVRAGAAGDGRDGNNLAEARLVVGQPAGTVVINEIMYQPFPGEAEYIELAAVDPPCDVDGWALHLGVKADGSPAKSIALTMNGEPAGVGQQTSDAPPVHFLVVASDSSVLDRFAYLADSSQGARLFVPGTALGLTNTGEFIRLVDPSGGAVDSVAYGPDWHNPSFSDVTGRSLEKIHPRLDGPARGSWSTSVVPEGGTPGKRNSVVTPVEPGVSVLRASPNPFSPDGDGREDHTVVSYRLTADAAYTIIRIFDVTGRLIRTLMERERGGYGGDAAWDGRDDDSRRVRMGVYILHLEARDAGGAVLAAAKAVVAVAGRL